MSELTSCNYCILKCIRARAKERGKKVILLSSNSMGGTDVYIIPKDMTIKEVRAMSEKERDEKFSWAWLMEVPDHCCCQEE